MTVLLHHTVVRTSDQDTAASFLAGLLDVPVGARTGPFTPVPVNADLTLDFDQRGVDGPGDVAPAHFGFLVDDATFDRLLTHLRARPDIAFGAGPGRGWNRGTNDLAGGRGTYVRDPDGHSYEFFTVAPD